MLSHLVSSLPAFNVKTSFALSLYYVQRYLSLEALLCTFHSCVLHATNSSSTCCLDACTGAATDTTSAAAMTDLTAVTNAADTI